MSMLLSGKPVAEHLNMKIREKCALLAEKGIQPVLAIVRVGNRGNDLSYERGATKRAEGLNVQVRHFAFPEDVTEEELIAKIEEINEDPTIHGCLLFRPLPAHLNAEKIAKTVLPSKDIDALTATSMGGLMTQSGIGFAPCTATACLELLKYYQISLRGKKVVVIGKSMAVGLPTALLLMNEEATVSVCHILTQPEDTKRFCMDADIIVSAAGCLNLIRGDAVRPGQVVVDVGVNVGPDGKLHGDVAFDEVEPIVSAITPVPGGVGAVTSTVLVGHAVEAACRMADCWE